MYDHLKEQGINVNVFYKLASSMYLLLSNCLKLLRVGTIINERDKIYTLSNENK